jgi:hypothetical protein
MKFMSGDAEKENTDVESCSGVRLEILKKFY